MNNLKTLPVEREIILSSGVLNKTPLELRTQKLLPTLDEVFKSRVGEENPFYDAATNTFQFEIDGYELVAFTNDNKLHIKFFGEIV